MAIQRLDFGTGGNNDGEVLRTAFPKLDANDAELEGLISAHETRIDDLETAVTAGVPSGTAGYALIGNGASVATTFQGFTQAGTGAVTRTWQSKMRESVSALDYIPTAYHANILAGTSTDDVTSYVQAAITYLLTLGGGTLYFPNGTYYFALASASLDPGSGGITFIGESRLDTILAWEEGAADLNSGTEKYLFKNTANTAKEPLLFENLKISGTLDTDLAQGGGNAMWLDHYPSITLRDVWFDQLTRIAHDFHYCDQVEVTGTWYTNIARDGCRARDCRFVIVTNCYFNRIGDDSIALHTNSSTIESFAPIREGTIVQNNILINAGIIKVLGARKCNISNNYCHLSNIHAVEVNTAPSENVEGDNPMYDIVISDNIMTDLVFITSATPSKPSSYIAIDQEVHRGGTDSNNVAPLLYDSVSAEFIKPWDWNAFNTEDPANAVPLTNGIRISGNIMRRTLPVATNFSDYGYGTLLRVGTAYDPQITDSHKRANGGITFTSPGGHNVVIDGNVFEHMTNGITLGAPTSNHQYRNWRITNNHAHDVISRFFLLNPAAYHCDISITDNHIDCDHYRENSNSNTDGTYDAGSTVPYGVDIGSNTGLTISRNRFRNVQQMIASNSPDANIIEDNIGFCGTPAASGFNVGNKGIGTIQVGAGRFRYVIVDADPTSGTYGAQSSVMLDQASSMPSSGWYYAGWFVRDTSAGATRVGWYRLTTGTGHVLNTDWAEIGTVKGPTSATDNALVRFDAATGRLLQNSGVIVDDSDNMTLPGSLTAQSTVAFTADISPSQITANQNDYSPTGLSTAAVLRLSSDATRNITGLDGGSDGRVIILHNVGANAIVLIDESASSTAANRFALVGDLTINGDHSVVLQYDSTSSRWRVVGGVSASAVGTAMNSGSAITDLADTDRFGVLDASASNALVPVTWASIKSEIVAEMAGSTLQAYDADLASWASVTRASGFDTFAATPSSANLRALLTDESGSSAAYFQGGALGTPSSGTLTNCTGLPVAGGGTGASTASGARTNLGAAANADIQEFTSSGTWTKPSGAVAVFVQVVGCGGGGGGGARVASGTACSGGGGGGGGANVDSWFLANDLGSTETITIGAAGTGGSGATSDGTAGSNGTAGGNSQFGSLLKAYGGGYGAGGQVAGASGGGGGGGTGSAGGNASAGTGGTSGTPSGAAGGSGVAGSSAQSNFGASGGGGVANGGGGGAAGNSGGSCGGGGGGGLTAAPAATNGGHGGASRNFAAGFPGGGTGGASGTAGTSPSASKIGVNSGGAGGGSSTAGVGGAGGTGGSYGGGGGGGGSAIGGNGGAGGNGGGGFVRVITYF